MARREHCVVALAALTIVPLAGSAVARDRCAASGSSLAVIDCADWPRAASLDPGCRPESRGSAWLCGANPARCRATEIVFYAARDWLRLAPSAEHSPCAPTTTSPFRRSSRTRRCSARTRHGVSGRWGRASTRWLRSTGRPGGNGVRATGRTWFDAGVEARHRMGAAGYDVGQGDTWAVNEFPSSVRRGRHGQDDARVRRRPL